MLPDRVYWGGHSTVFCNVSAKNTGPKSKHIEMARGPTVKHSAATAVYLPQMSKSWIVGKQKKVDLFEIDAHGTALHWILCPHRTLGQMAQASQPVGCWQHCAMACAEEWRGRPALRNTHGRSSWEHRAVQARIPTLGSCGRGIINSRPVWASQ